MMTTPQKGKKAMELALHSVGYSGTWGGQVRLPLWDFLKKARELGYGAVELMAKRPHASPLDLDEEGRRDIQHILQGEGLKLACMASYHDWSGPSGHPDMAHTEKELVYIQEVIKLASDLGCPLVRTYTGFFYDDIPYRQQWDRCVQGLKEAARIASHYGVTLGIQNHSCIPAIPTACSTSSRMSENPMWGSYSTLP